MFNNGYMGMEWSLIESGVYVRTIIVAVLLTISSAVRGGNRPDGERQRLGSVYDLLGEFMVALVWQLLGVKISDADEQHDDDDDGTDGDEDGDQP